MVVTSSTCYDVVTFLTQWGKSASNFVSISSLVVKIIKEMPGSEASRTPCISTTRCVLCHKSAVFISFEAEVWNHASQLPFPILSQINPAHALPNYFFFLKIHFNIILQSKLDLPSRVSSPGYPTKTRHAFHFFLSRVTWTHTCKLDLIDSTTAYTHTCSRSVS